MDECNVCWSSHGCSLEMGHEGNHVCLINMGPDWKIICCEHDGTYMITEKKVEVEAFTI